MVIFRNAHKYSSYVPSRHMLDCTSLLLKKLCMARRLSGPLNWTEVTSLQGRDARDTYRVQLPLPQLQQHSVPRISVPAWESAEQNPRQSTLDRPLESEVALLPQCTVPSTLRAACHCSITLPSWHTCGEGAETGKGNRHREPPGIWFIAEVVQWSQARKDGFLINAGEKVTNHKKNLHHI